MKKFVKTATIAVFTTAALLSTACNTVQGIGQDTESVGKEIDKIGKKAED